MRGRWGLAVVVASAGVLLAATLGLVTLGVLSSATEADRGVIERVLREQATLVLLSWVLATAVFGALIVRAWDRYVNLPERLAAATSLIATANPAHRLAETGPTPLRHVAAAVNRLADRYQDEQSDVAGRIAEASADLEEERNRLAVLMSELRVAVLVCNADGRILLYNAAARHLFDADGSGSHALVGLGRSVFAILDRNLVAYALEYLGTAPGRVQPVAAAHHGRLLRAHIAPVAAAARQSDEASSGFVVILEDMTRRAQTAQARDDLLGSLTGGSRSALGSIRAAVESILDYPQMAPEQKARFLEVISEEATGLGRRLEEALTATANVLDDTWLIADLHSSDLLDTMARGLEREELKVAVQEPPETLWVHVDGFALQRAVAFLGDRLRADQGVTEFGLRIRSTGRLGELDLTWCGKPLDTATLREWISQPPPTGASADGPSHHDVIIRHGGEIWSGSEAEPDGGGFTAYIRMLLPLAQRGESAGTAQTVRPPDTQPVEERLATYDFSLLTASHLPGRWQDRALDELTYTVFDTETTGLDPAQGDAIISVGAVRIVNGRLLRQETFDQLVDPRRSVPEASIRIHGIQPQLLQGQPTINAVLPDFAAFAEDTVLVGHNVAFDLQFLRLNEASAGPLLSQPVLDTLLLSAVVHPEQESHSLEEMAARLGVNVIGRHTALGDSLVTGEVFLKLLRLMIHQGIRTLGEAQDAAKRTYQAKVSDSLYVKD